MWNRISAGTLAIRAGVKEGRTEGKGDKMTFNFPLGLDDFRLLVYVGQSIRKMAATFVCIHVALFQISHLAIALRHVVPTRY